MTFSRGDFVFIDESKRRDYIMVTAAVAPARLASMRSALRPLLLTPGQRRIHFNREGDSRRKALPSSMTQLEDVRCSVWIASDPVERVARERCLRAIASDMSRDAACSLTLERDESIERSDRQVLRDAFRRLSDASVAYRHVAPHDEPILWISDAVAWCYSRRGDWIRRATPLVADRVTRL